MDFNSYTPDIQRKIEAGYAFCATCSSLIQTYPASDALFRICGAFKAGPRIHDQVEWSKAKGSPRVFLCYAGPDRDRVLQLYDRLTADGFDPWMDTRNLLPGQAWELEIQRAIRSADYFIACISSHFQQRTYGLREIRWALEVLDTIPEGRIYLIPARLEACTVEERLFHRQWVDLFEPNGYEHLVNALRWSFQPQTTKEGRPN
jgi:hypothetical protein